MAKQSPLERYVLVLEEVAAANAASLSLSEIAQRCDLPVPSAHRIIQSLLKSQLLAVRDGSKQYGLGSRLFRLLHAGTDDGWIKIAAQPILDRVADTMHETAYLAQLVGKTIVSICWAAPESGLRSKVYPGDVMPPHAAASAKAILAHQPESVVLRALAGTREQYTPQTRTELVPIQKEHARIRREGFAACWNEMEVGLGALACPVELSGAGVQYAVAVTGTTARLKARPITETISILQGAAEELRHALEDGVRSAALPKSNRSTLRGERTAPSVRAPIGSTGQRRIKRTRTS